MVSMQAARIHAMHDPTEGGLASGLWELARASGVGLQVDRGAIAILPETGRLCGEFGIDPLGAIASGALLIAVDQEQVQRVLDALRGEGIAAAVIARAIEGDEVRWQDGSPLPRFDRDELARLFETA
jgi:hydrogenase maturation factor